MSTSSLVIFLCPGGDSLGLYERDYNNGDNDVNVRG